MVRLTDIRNGLVRFLKMYKIAVKPIKQGVLNIKDL